MSEQIGTTAAQGRLPAILLVDDEQRSLDAMEMALEDEFAVFTASSGEAALEVLAEQWIQVILCDQRMPGMTGVELLTQVRERWPETIRVIVTGYTETDDIIRAINEAGIYQFLAKPWHPDQLLMAARNGAKLFQLQRDHDRMSLELKQLTPVAERRVSSRHAVLKMGYGFDRIVRTTGSPMDALCITAAQIATFDVPALITGETGTGKELLAKAIHYGSLRSERPFHAVHCGAIPDELLESELFGHRKGAFTGAHANRMGLLEQADGGTVFLDEIGDTSAAFQVKLLRFLQEGEIRPVGSNDTLTVNVRIIAATNRDLEDEARAGNFREDLYYRLAVSPLRVPALRERPGDILPLCEFLLEAAMATHGKRVDGLDPAAMEFLTAYDWPGNVRELENEILRMLMMATGDALGPEDITPRILRAVPKGVEADPVADAALCIEGTLKERVEKMEARLLRETLTRLRWNKSRAAEELGLSRVGLRAKLDRYGIEPPVRAVDEDGEEDEMGAVKAAQ
ncbi:MAG: sigma-54-dependent transcriptional regulator [Rhodospirillaceae bacterium]